MAQGLLPKRGIWTGILLLLLIMEAVSFKHISLLVSTPMKQMQLTRACRARTSTQNEIRATILQPFADNLEN